MSKDKKGTKYDESSIEVLEGLDGVRKKPGMYLGARGTPMVYRMVKELVDNCCDEFAAGRNTTVEVIALPKTNQYIVADMAQGIPVGKNKTTGLSTLTTIFTILHAGGKFNDKAYKTSCFTGETEIRLLDGNVRTFEWLANNYQDHGFWVLSCTLEGQLIPGYAYAPRLTKYVTELCEVTLSNGKTERCTPDHRWLLRTGEYVEAQDLKATDSLMARIESDSDQALGEPEEAGSRQVINVALIKLDVPVPVYDMTVNMYHNFMLHSGVFTHNSGVHGVGSSAVNAVCTNFDVWTKRDGIWYSQFFSEGKPVSELKKKAVVPKEISKYLAAKNIDKYGTIIRCVPDQTIVSEDAIDTKRKKNSVLTQASLDYHEAKDWLELIADLNPGLKVNYTYQKVKEGKTKTLTHEFHNKQGLASIVKDLCTDHEWTALAKPLVIEAPNLNLCIQWCSYEETDHFKTYVNTSPTREHGSHFDGFFSALSKAIARYNKEPARGKKTQFKPRDVLHGMIGVLNFKMSQAEFSSQTKDRLTSKVDKEVEELVSDELNKYFANNEKLVKTIIKRAAVISKGREELKKVMKSVSEVKKGSRGSLPSSLVASPRCKPEQRELVIVEGDSAGGSAKFARLPHQEIFKLTGKIANAARMPLSKLLGSETIIDLLVSIGIDPTSLDIEQDNPTFSTNKMRIKSLFILTDADPDGKHISVLLLTLLFRLIPDMFSENRVYFIDAPLYSAFHNNKRYMGPTFEAVYKQLPPNTPKQVVSRAKGWGEISPDMLHHVAFDPVNRKLICIKPPKGADEEWFRSIVGSDSSARKELLGL